MLEAIDNPSLAYNNAFPLGQPFKSLYAAHALYEYLSSSRPRPAASEADNQPPDKDGDLSPRAAFLLRTMSLVVMAISDPQVLAQCPNQELQIELGSALVGLFVSLLGGMYHPSNRILYFTFTDGVISRPGATDICSRVPHRALVGSSSCDPVVGCLASLPEEGSEACGSLSSEHSGGLLQERQLHVSFHRPPRSPSHDWNPAFT